MKYKKITHPKVRKGGTKEQKANETKGKIFGRFIPNYIKSHIKCKLFNHSA